MRLGSRQIFKEDYFENNEVFAWDVRTIILTAIIGALAGFIISGVLPI